MRNRLKGLIVCLMSALLLPAVALAQNAPSTPAKAAGTGAAKASAPVRAHDITGVWFHQGAGARTNKPAPLTPWGQAQFSTHHTDQGGLVADSTDPMIHCDPLGFPRNIVWEDRGIQFVPAGTKMVELFQYQKVWREIWTDGRALPKNAGSDDVNAPDPRYYGYSTGHWDGDHTFVVDSVGTDDRTWLDNAGDPHSNELRVEERYTRPDHDHLQIIVKADDPKAYTQPWVVSTVDYTWNPKQEFEEQLCIPSDAQAYMDAIANPAGKKK
jgi:hypothetical protein